MSFCEYVYHFLLHINIHFCKIDVSLPPDNKLEIKDVVRIMIELPHVFFDILPNIRSDLYLSACNGNVHYDLLRFDGKIFSSFRYFATVLRAIFIPLF